MIFIRRGVSISSAGRVYHILRVDLTSLDKFSFSENRRFSCSHWNSRCSRFDPPIASVHPDAVYTFGQIKEVHLFCRRTCRFCLEDDLF